MREQGRIARRDVVRGLVTGAAFAPWLGPRAARAAGIANGPVLSGTEFALSLDRVAINKSGATDWANAINGIVPGPVLYWREGDVVTLRVTNNLPEMTGLHWHGIILPNGMDGVPGLEFPGIQPGETFTYRFPVLQSGTYWYHSHMGYQEQKGAYGGLVIAPRGQPIVTADRDYVVVLSDWMDGDPYGVQNTLKHQGGYYNFHRRTLATFLADAQASGLGATISERLSWARMRMDPTGINQPTGELYTYLMNGVAADGNWTALFRPGERVRLRFINASAISFYDVRIPGLGLSVVHVHGNDVVPVPVDEFRIGVAETYDVIVQPTEDRAYTIFAQSIDRSGYARGTLAPRAGMVAEVPDMDARPMRTMTDMGMPMMAPTQIGASNPDDTRLGGIKPSKREAMKLDVNGMPAMQKMTKDPPDEPMAGVELQHVARMPTDRLGLPGDGLNQARRRVLTYGDLRSVRPGVDTREPSREIVLHLTGNMQRFMWGFDGKKYSEVGPIDVRLGERFRLRFINDTMMTHPIHLHGMWMELENGGGEHRPYLHTISVKPGEDVSLRVTPVATGQWPMHCHVLYHFEAGMFRTMRVLPA